MFLRKSMGYGGCRFAALLRELKPFLYHKEGIAGSPICSFVYFQFDRTEARAVKDGLVPISDSR